MHMSQIKILGYFAFTYRQQFALLRRLRAWGNIVKQQSENRTLNPETLKTGFHSLWSDAVRGRPGY
jgi:hypothetical protein